MLRCVRSWSVLQELVRRAPDRFRVEMRGIVHDAVADVPKKAAASQGLAYHGRYKVPDDLPTMFDEVDLCWMVHHDSLRPYENWGWARSNRLYEAGWYNTPIIGQYDKDDSRVIEELDCGITLDISQPEEAIEKLLAIQPSDLRRWRENLRATPRERFALSDEHERLLQELELGRR